MAAQTDEDRDATEGADGEDRILTVPNAITAVRLACLPLFLWLLFAQDDRVWAASVLGALGATDWVDGFLARRWNQVSTLGKVLDPVADRLLFFVGGEAIIIDGSIPIWVAVLVLTREVLVSMATVVLALAGAKRIDVTWWGKAGTFCVMFAFPMFLASEGQLFWRDEARALAWGFVIPGLVFGYIALALYVPLGLRDLREGRAGRAEPTADGPDRDPTSAR
ncbi:CDP-alcohol phosphatidyltransferase family protein [soil metagenome]